jgi:phospholipid-translocating ATPase
VLECVHGDYLLHKLSESPVLKVPDFNKPFVVQTDASDVGIRAILSQTDEKGHEHPIAFASRKLKPREQKYAVIEKECLAIIWALGFFYPYLYGQHFVIETDHQPLKWLHQMRNKNQRLTCWALSLQPFKYDIRHRAGAQHKNADGLSRGPPDPAMAIQRGEVCDEAEPQG